MPLHVGHIALINFASEQCDEVIVSMSFTANDPIPAAIRFHWLQSQFASNKKIHPKLIADDFDHPEKPLIERTNEWATVIAKVYPKIDLIISSEAYGEPFANALGASHEEFDRPRKQNPISATQIRNEPFRHWKFIPEVVRPYFVKCICFFGAESTGKSTMAIKMAEKYQTIFVPEVAREILTSNDFSSEDIVKIGHAHHARIANAKKIANKILFCDTDVLTTQIYSEHYLNEIPPVLFEIERQTQYDKYFLFDIDVPWVSDGLRDLGDQRQQMHVKFKEALVLREIPFVTVQGNWQEREAIISKEIDKLLNDKG